MYRVQELIATININIVNHFSAIGFLGWHARTTVILNLLS